MSIRIARLSIFIFWVIAFIMDEVLILAQMNTPNLNNYESAEIRSWACRVAYIIVPVLAAFASFWFPPERTSEKKSKKSVDQGSIAIEQIIVLFILTILVHGAFFCYLYFFIHLPFPELLANPNHYDSSDTYSARMEWGLNLFLVILTLANIPIGWLLRRPST